MRSYWAVADGGMKKKLFCVIVFVCLSVQFVSAFYLNDQFGAIAIYAGKNITTDSEFIRETEEAANQTVTQYGATYIGRAEKLTKKQLDAVQGVFFGV